MKHSLSNLPIVDEPHLSIKLKRWCLKQNKKMRAELLVIYSQELLNNLFFHPYLVGWCLS